MSRVTVRAATKNDVDCLSALAIYVFLDTYATSGISQDLAEEVLAGYSIDLFSQRTDSTAQCEIHVAEDRDCMCGFIEFEETTMVPIPELNNGLEVKMLYVHPKLHGLGIGRILLAVSESHCKKHDLKFLWLTTWAGNSNAIAFYRHCGFKDIGTTEHIINKISYENRIHVKHLL